VYIDTASDGSSVQKLLPIESLVEITEGGN